MDLAIISSPIIMVLIIVGTVRYNKLRRNWYGIIGVGGSYFSLIGLIVLFELIGTIAQMIAGTAEMEMSIFEGILTIAVMLAALAYLGFVMLTRCKTVKQRIMLPFVACMIAFGFCIRFLMKLFLHMPMEDGKPTASFPTVLYDDQENEYRLQSDSGDHADYYCSATGRTVQFWESDMADGLPSGWRIGA